MTKGIKVLYIDDEPVNVQLFEIIFSRKYAVLSGSSGFDGLKILENNPDTSVIISDMKMPGMSGIEFVLKAKEKFPDKNYYILTGYDITEEIQTAINNGLIRNHFKKPFNLDKIESSINEAARFN